MSLLLVILGVAGIVLIYYGVTGTRPQEVIRRAFSGAK